MLVYSINVVLGKLILLLGLGIEVVLIVVVLFIFVYLFYKVVFFMVVGNIDKVMGI